MIHRCVFLLLTAVVSFSSTLLAADGPTTPNPGLHYYYPVATAGEPRVVKVDVCVYGGTPGGVAAAVQARRMGKTAALAVFRRHVGGMTSAGLTSVDLGRKESIGGMGAEFLDRVGKWRDFRPSEAETVFRNMLAEAGVEVYYEHRLSGVAKEGERIRVVRFENGRTIEAKMFVDATYEGDLFALAGCSYHVGREDNSQYGETVNGFQIAKTHQFRFPTDPYRVKGDPASGLLPGIVAGPLPAAGTGDKRVQAYNFRMWATAGADRIPFPKPAGYDRAEFALLERYLTTNPGFDWNLKYSHGPVKLNEGDCNNAGPISTDYVGASDAWPEGDYTTRERIFQAHVRYQQGMMWFLGNDESVPAILRDRVKQFGLPRDEFTETGGWPYELYVREGRRLVSDYVMMEHNCRGTTVAEDSIGLASYTMDSHHTSRVVIDGQVVAEGCVEAKIPGAYPVSYRAIVPKAGECTNLLVPVCLSSTHMAYGSIRMEPVFMILGQSAGTAAGMAIEEGIAVQGVDYKKLESRLLADKQKLK